MYSLARATIKGASEVEQAWLNELGEALGLSPEWAEIPD